MVCFFGLDFLRFLVIGRRSLFSYTKDVCSIGIELPVESLVGNFISSFEHSKLIKDRLPNVGVSIIVVRVAVKEIIEEMLLR